MLRLVRRVLLALGVGSLVATVLRLRNPAEVAHSEGKWRELRGQDLH